MMIDKTKRDRKDKQLRTAKIKTNENKLKIIPLAVNEDIIEEGTHIPFSEHGKVLGFTINRPKINKHIQDITNKVKRVLMDLNRFRELPTQIKVHLIKAYILPVIHYALQFLYSLQAKQTP